jgi:dipeptidyl aminopeptidase/acylaminoacyl peptidase
MLSPAKSRGIAMHRSTEDLSASNLVRIFFVLLTALTSGSATAQEAERRAFQPEDVHSIQNVGDIAVSPEGDWVAYRVGTTNVDKDKSSSDLFMVSWDGTTRIQLTHTEDSSEGSPRFSPDGKYLAFTAARDDGIEEEDDPAAKSQVWLLNRSGGEARRLTEMPGGVSSFEWSPDSTRLVIVSMDPEDDGEEEEGEAADDDAPSHETPDPIVIDRYQFKQDRIGYLVDRYQRLYVFDVETREATLLTPGPYNSVQPAWGPGSDVIAFSSRRHGDPDRNRNSDIFLIEPVAGAEPRQLTTWEGPDASPVFSPDGRQIVYLQGGSKKYSGYDGSQPAVISVNGGDPVLPALELNRHVSSPRWSGDGKTVYYLVPDDRVQWIASVPADGGDVEKHYPVADVPGVVRSYAVGARGLVALATFGQQPAEIYRIDGTALSDHNRALLDEIEWASVEAYDAVSADGVKVGSMLLKPPGYRPGVAYPTIAYVHGGPVGQDGFDFDYMSQGLAAQGYLVVNPNYRGSSGRGSEFANAIYAKWGTLEITDIHAVMDKLVEDGLADPERLGIGGWSYGGINTNFAIASDTRFAAAVSGASASNYIAGWGTDQYIWQYENELGRPWESLDTYLEMSYPFLKADRIETPTLFMCGELDFNVPLINSEQMYQALKSLNVPTQLVIYPGEYHGLSKPSYIQDRLQRMIHWYDEYLGGGVR